MSSETVSAGGRIIPTFRCKDAAAEIDWLCRAFGFRRHFVAEEAGVIVHAQLTFLNGMVMLGQARDDDYGSMVGPAADAGILTQSAYIVVDDVDSLYRRALDAGAEVVTELHDPDYGGRMFAVRDPEGQVWSFGTYDPYAEA